VLRADISLVIRNSKPRLKFARALSSIVASYMHQLMHRVGLQSALVTQKPW